MLASLFSAAASALSTTARDELQLEPAVLNVSLEREYHDAGPHGRQRAYWDRATLVARHQAVSASLDGSGDITADSAMWWRNQPLATAAASPPVSPVAQKLACGDEQCEGTRRTTWLWSYPGSGNTMARMLIEAASGWLTGSVYHDLSLDGEFEAERAGPGDEGQLFVKTHAFDPEDPMTSHPEANVKRSVMLIRNPYDAILAEYKRRRELVKEGQGDAHADSTAHTAEIGGIDFEHFGDGGGGGGWEGARKEAVKWANTLAKQHAYSNPKLNVRYEDLIGTGKLVWLQAIITFAGVSVSSSRASCAFEHAEAFHRTPELTAVNAFCYGPGHAQLREDVWRAAREQAAPFGYEELSCPEQQG